MAEADARDASAPPRASAVGGALRVLAGGWGEARAAHALAVGADPVAAAALRTEELVAVGAAPPIVAHACPVGACPVGAAAAGALDLLCARVPRVARSTEAAAIDAVTVRTAAAVARAQRTVVALPAELTGARAGDRVTRAAVRAALGARTARAIRALEALDA